jgi:hypothetical protein
MILKKNCFNFFNSNLNFLFLIFLGDSQIKVSFLSLCIEMERISYAFVEKN